MNRIEVESSIKLMYNTILEREVDIDSLNHLTAQIMLQKQTLEDIHDMILNSPMSAC